MSDILNISRRGFLQGMVTTGALVLSVRILPSGLLAEPAAYAGTHADHATLHPSVYFGIDTDGTVHIVAHRSEMGTGIRTSLPLVLADELDADWNRVKIEQAIGDARYGSQETDGSQSIREFYDAMREAGATARLMLIRAAAQQWNVPESACRAELHNIVHASPIRKLGYGELTLAAAKLPVPDKKELQFKPPSAWRYVGKGMVSYDLSHLVTGQAIYGMDAHMDNMVYASVEHPPVLGGKIKSYDDKAALQVPGVRQTIPIDTFKPPHEYQALGGVAVIADNTWAAFQGRKKLNVTWENGAHAAFNSDEFKKEMQATARKPGKAVRNEGDVDGSFAKGGKVLEADYYVPLLAHASMEPPVAVADFRDGKLTAWAPTQDPQATQDAVSKALGIAKENVICHVTLLGGGFGRKSMPDYIVEASLLSRKVGRPVKVVWTREDDIKFDYFHAVAAMYMKAAVDNRGMPTAWLQRSVFTPIPSTFDASATYGGDDELGMGFTDIPFEISNLRVENGPAPAHVRIGWLRSVANVYHGFAVKSFMDELAHNAGRDPVDYLLALLGRPRILDLKATKYSNYGADYQKFPIDTARLRKVVEVVAEKSGWGKRQLGKGRAQGIAVHRSFCTYVASVVEVEVTPQGDVHIPRVDTALDAGLVVNPEITRAQFQGANVFATSLAMMGEITAKNGAIEQSNFNDYPVARINEAPRENNIYIVESTAPPAGVGEPGVPPFAPALCNAIFAATGKRVRELPISKANLKT